MSTRGAYGFRIKNVDKITYNNSDSYPSGLGASVLSFIKRNTIAQLRSIALNQRMVNEDDDVPEADRKKYAAFCNLDVGVGSHKSPSWYQQLRRAQGDFEAYENGLDVMIDGAGFLRDGLFCEWAYIINLDEEALEIYKGFNKNLKALGRYADTGITDETGYAGVALVKVIPFEYIRDAHIDILVTKLAEELS